MLTLRTVALQFTICVLIHVLLSLCHPCRHETHMIRALLAVVCWKRLGLYFHLFPTITSPIMHPASHCNTLQLSAAHCNTPEGHTATHRGALWRHNPATHCNTLPHTCNTSGGGRTAGCCMATTLNGEIVPGCAPENWFLWAGTTCTNFTRVAISLCDDIPFGSGTVWGSDTWNLEPMYFAKNQGRCTKSGHNPVHSELYTANDFTWRFTTLRSDLRVVGTSRWREHFAKSWITLHTWYRSPVPLVNVAFTSARPTDLANVMLEPTEIVTAPMAHTSCKLANKSASVTQSVTRGAGGGVHVFKANSLSRMFLVMACNSHPAWLLLLAAASLTETCMLSMIWALTFCMSPYMSGFDHTRATIPCAFGKVQGRFLDLCCCRGLQIPRSRFPLDLPGVHALPTVSAMCCKLETCPEGIAALPDPLPCFPESFDRSCWFIVHYRTKWAVYHIVK